jgi:hypothetical protein
MNSSAYDRWLERLQKALAHVWLYELETLARIPRKDRERVAMQRAIALARSNQRFFKNSAVLE